MADDTAKLVLSLEARFDKFEKAMVDATKVVEKQTKVIEASFTAMTGVISDKLSAIQSTLISQTGTLGLALSKLGPIGITAAVGIGAMVVALNEVSKATDRINQKAVNIRAFSVGTGFSIEDAQGIRKAIIGLGLDTEQVQTAIQKFTVELQKLKTEGGGPLTEALIGVDQQLLSNMRNAESTSEAFKLLITALGQMSTTARNQLSRAAGGRGGIGAFAEIAEESEKFFRLWREGMNGAKTEAELKKIVDRARELNVQLKSAEAQWDKAMPDDFFMRKKIEQFEALTAIYKAWNEQGAIAAGRELLKHSLNQLPDLTTGGRAPLQIGVGAMPAKPLPPAETVPDLRNMEAANRLREAGLASLNEQIDALERMQLLRGALAPKEAEELQRLTLAREQAKIAAPTPAQQSAAVQGQRLITEATELQTLAIREQLGIATEAEMLRSKAIVIERQLSDGRINALQAERAAILAAKEAREKYEQVLVRSSSLPGLKQAQLDLENNAKQLDKIGLQSLNAFSDNMADVVLGTKKLADAFKDMTNIILKEIIKLALQKAIIGPLMGGLGSIPGLTPKMAGGPVLSGVPYIVGERGPELFVPSSSGGIVPNNRLGGGGSTVIINDYSGTAQVSQNKSGEGGGVEVFIPALEQMLAGGVSRGRGALSKSMDARRRGTNLYG